MTVADTCYHQSFWGGHPSCMEVGESIAKRYRIERLVGSGGAAEVYEVSDLNTQARVALKRLNTGEPNALAEMMFAREFNALAQLSHPLIIRAFDYGRHAGTPYYTMELLSGDTLRHLAPLGFREACHLLRDIASALAIIHSRRFVHRDVTTRNVCRDADGHAKLLDFGTLTPMGAVRDLVGTPPFVPPEAVEEQRLDGRADLFALGAVAYFLLTGEHAYPARTFRELGEAWRYPVSPPSAWARDVPPALDHLVLSLLSLAKAARPQNAAEVFQRLSAIGSLPSVEAPEVAEAYLATPTLVARESALGRFRKHLDRLERGRGHALVVEGVRGMGRTRLLGALLLEAKLRGYLTLRANGREVSNEPFALMRALVHELVAADPAVFREVAEHTGFYPAAEDGAAAGGAGDEENFRPEAVRLADFFTEVAERAPLVIGVDDVDDVDDRSLTALALLCGRARSLPLEVVCTADIREDRAAIRELRHATTALLLEPLAASDTRLLVSSLFGEVAHVDALAAWMHRVTGGSPRAALELAQHLVDREIATYREGTWALPASLAGLGLPETMDQALEARISALGPAARDLVRTLSLMTEHDPLLVSDYVSLAEGANLAPMFEALNELIAASILVGAGPAYVFAHQQLVRVVRKSIPEAELPHMHRRLAEAYESGSGRGTLLVVYHLFQAGDRRAAFSAAVRAIAERNDLGARGSSLARSDEIAEINESLFVWGIENAMPRKDLVLLGRNVLQLASVVNVELVRHANLILEPLRSESGLVYWDEFPDVANDGERMLRCIGRAAAEYERTPEPERGLSPDKAIEELAVSAAMLVGVFTREFDTEGAASVGALLRPLRPLSPGVDVIAEIVEVAEKSLRGRDVTADRARMIERAASPIPGVDDLSRQGLQLVTQFYVALEETTHGHERAAERVAPLEAYPHLAPLAWQVRMLVHLFRGEDQQAAAARRKRDAATIGRTEVDRHLDLSLLYEGSVSALLGDLLALRRVLTVMEERAERSPGWAPYYHYLKGCLHSLRGETEKALEEHERALALVPKPGVHAAWAYCVNHLAATLVELDRGHDAAALMTQAMQDVEGLALVPQQLAQLEMSLALAKASLGDPAEAEEATLVAKRALNRMLALGTGGVVLVEQYAKQALVALKTNDRATFRAAASVIEAMCAKTESAAFAAKHEYLLRQARTSASFRPVAPTASELVTRRESHTTMVLGLRAELESCDGSAARAARVLGVLLEWSGTDSGFLYLHVPGHLTLAASSVGLTPPSSLDDAVNDWLRAFMAGDGTRSASRYQSDSGDSADADFDTVGLVAHREDGAVLAGVAALSRSRPGRTIPESVLDALGESLLCAGDAVGVAVQG